MSNKSAISRRAMRVLSATSCALRATKSALIAAICETVSGGGGWARGGHDLSLPIHPSSTRVDPAGFRHLNKPRLSQGCGVSLMMNDGLGVYLPRARDRRRLIGLRRELLRRGLLRTCHAVFQTGRDESRQ